jgi:hypothetical protein
MTDKPTAARTRTLRPRLLRGDVTARQPLCSRCPIRFKSLSPILAALEASSVLPDLVTDR